jgi:hypothetical protein
MKYYSCYGSIGLCGTQSIKMFYLCYYIIYYLHLFQIRSRVNNTLLFDFWNKVTGVQIQKSKPKTLEHKDVRWEYMQYLTLSQASYDSRYV